jgi:hypothetical protein
VKVAPVSGDLLVKLTATAVAVGLVLYVVKRATGAVGDNISALANQFYAPFKAAEAGIEAGTVAGNFATPAAIDATFAPQPGDVYAGGGNFGMPAPNAGAGRGFINPSFPSNSVNGYSLDNLGAMP